MRSVFVALALFVTTTGAAEPPPKLQPPAVKFKDVVRHDGHTWLRFEVTNPNATPVPYVGYLPEAFAPRLKEGTIAPLYDVQRLQGDKWKAEPIGWCGTGVGDVRLPAKGTVTFEIAPPTGEWEAVRVALNWSVEPDPKSSYTAWSEPVKRTVLDPEKP